MAKAVEDMGFDDLAAACDGYMCRALPTPLALAPTLEAPIGLKGLISSS